MIPAPPARHVIPAPPARHVTPAPPARDVTPAPPARDVPPAPPVDEIVALLAEVTGEDTQWLAGVGAASRLDGDLLLDSVEVAALGELLRARHGPAVNLIGYLADLDLDQLIALTVGDVAGHVAQHAAPNGSARR